MLEIKIKIWEVAVTDKDKVEGMGWVAHSAGDEWLRLREKEIIRGEEVMEVRDQSIEMIIYMEIEIAKNYHEHIIGMSEGMFQA